MLMVIHYLYKRTYAHMPRSILINKDSILTWLLNPIISPDSKYNNFSFNFTLSLYLVFKYKLIFIFSSS